MDITLNASIRKYTGFKDIYEMVNTNKNYRPSINTKGCSTMNRALLRIANKYDKVMAAIGDDRRAYRY